MIGRPRRLLSASLEAPVSSKAPDPPWHVSASPERHMEPLGKAESHGPPQHGARSIDIMEVTVHSQQEHQNRALT
jgi:hypothetical protein